VRALAAAGEATLGSAVSLFITLEGIEGSGKSSHARTLAAALRDAGHAVIETREPGGTTAGAALRTLLLGSETPLTGLAELFLYCADRAQHLSQVVRPALAAGRIVICDRFSDSTIAYKAMDAGRPRRRARARRARERWPVPARPSCSTVRSASGSGVSGAGLDRSLRARDRRVPRAHPRGLLAIAAAAPERVMVIDSTQDAAVVGAQLEAATRARLEAAA
jgi:dTMP kinase